MPVWIKEKLLLKRLLLEELSRLAGHPVREAKLLFPEHHLSHAASAFYPSPFAEAAILTIDGVGEWATASICHGKGGGIEILRELASRTRSACSTRRSRTTSASGSTPASTS